MIPMTEVDPQTEQDRIDAKRTAAPVERRAATNFWIMLNRPEVPDMVTEWPKLMREAMGFMGIDDLEKFKDFLHWTLEENPKSAEYLRLARDPARSLVKNIETLKRYYLAWYKRQEIQNRKGKPAKAPVAAAAKDDSDDNGLVAGYSQEQISAKAEACKDNPWVQENDSSSARKRSGFVSHLMSLEPPKSVKKKVDGKPLPRYRQESGKREILKGNV